MKENSIEETIKQLKLILKIRKEQKEIIECAGGSCINCNPDIEALTNSIDILSDYKGVLKENEELLQEKINNQKIIALAQNNMLNYQAGFEDGKNGRTSAVQSIIENQQYYIFQKQIEKYERHIEKLQKENEELENDNKYLRERETYLEKRRSDIINLFQNQKTATTIPIQKIKDKIEEIQKEYNKLDKQVDESIKSVNKDVSTYYENKERISIMQTLSYFIDNLQELIEEREEKKNGKNI